MSFGLAGSLGRRRERRRRRGEFIGELSLGKIYPLEVATCKLV